MPLSEKYLVLELFVLKKTILSLIQISSLIMCQK